MFQATSARRLFGPSELFPLDQPPRFSARRALLPSVAREIEASFDPRSPLSRLLGGVPSRKALERLATSASELCSGRASDTRRRAFRSAPGRCSLGLPSPPRYPALPLGRSPPLTRFGPPARPEDRVGTPAPQGINPAEPGNRSEERKHPPWGLPPRTSPAARPCDVAAPGPRRRHYPTSTDTNA